MASDTHVSYEVPVHCPDLCTLHCFLRLTEGETMYTSSALVIVLASAFAVVAAWTLWNRAQRAIKYDLEKIPGPKQLPFIGNLGAVIGSSYVHKVSADGFLKTGCSCGFASAVHARTCLPPLCFAKSRTKLTQHCCASDLELIFASFARKRSSIVALVQLLVTCRGCWKQKRSLRRFWQNGRISMGPSSSGTSRA